MGRLSSEDTSWVADELTDWRNAIYTVDDKNAEFHTKTNKGREANAYLTYLVTNYDSLPSVIVFLHSHRNGWPGGWHTDAPNYDNAVAVRRLNTDFIRSHGYANLRCNHNPGCPEEIRPLRNVTEDDPRSKTELAFPAAWLELFGNNEVPEVIATPCCAQFAVSKEQVLQRPLDDYKRYLQWVEQTPLEDATAGRVFEYLWHIIFGQPAV
jgi:hypothetical protein